MTETERKPQAPIWKKFIRGPRPQGQSLHPGVESDGDSYTKTKPAKWSLGILNDKDTDEVPGMWSHEDSSRTISMRNQTNLLPCYQDRFFSCLAPTAMSL